MTFDQISNIGHSMDEVLPFKGIEITGEIEKRYRNGIPFTNQDDYKINSVQNQFIDSDFFWIYNSMKSIIGLAKNNNGKFISIFNLSIV